MAKKSDKPASGPRAGLIRKMHPSKLRVSPKFHAILACMLGQKWTTPWYTSLCITSDGCLLGERAGDVGFNDFIGDVADLEANLRGVCQAIRASETETGYLLKLMDRYRV